MRTNVTLGSAFPVSTLGACCCKVQGTPQPPVTPGQQPAVNTGIVPQQRVPVTEDSKPPVGLILAALALLAGGNG